ncbi:Hpt domain-containing protein [Celeribacter persicus]|nr:Hpt domain-containing protein [Celeribacter persicus]
MAEALGRTRQRFIDDLIVKLSEIETLQTRINGKRDDKDALARLAFLTHRLNGIAATVNFPQIGESAADVEQAVSRFDRSDRQLSELSELIDILLDLMEDAIVDEM